MAVKFCTGCGETKPLGDFNRATKSRDGRVHRCRPCQSAASRAWYEQNRERVNERNLAYYHANKDKWQESHIRYRYSMTAEQRDQILAAQGGHCALCPLTESAGRQHLDIDHDHGCCADYRKTCGRCIRGLLCRGCNTALPTVERWIAAGLIASNSPLALYMESRFDWTT